jgi:hypothetical protein
MIVYIYWMKKKIGTFCDFNMNKNMLMVVLVVSRFCDQRLDQIMALLCSSKSN